MKLYVVPGCLYGTYCSIIGSPCLPCIFEEMVEDDLRASCQSRIAFRSIAHGVRYTSIGWQQDCLARRSWRVETYSWQTYALQVKVSLCASLHNRRALLEAVSTKKLSLQILGRLLVVRQGRRQKLVLRVS